MNAELFKAIALIGLAVFLNCLILVCFYLFGVYGIFYG